MFRTCRVLLQNKSEKLVHLVGFLIRIYHDARSSECQNSPKLIISILYRGPTGEFNPSIKNLDDALKHLYKPKVEYLFCGDKHSLCHWKKLGGGELASLLATYNLSHTVTFGTRIQNNSSTASDNIFVNNSRINLYSISPIINGLWDHAAQILQVKNIHATINKFPLKQRTRLIGNEIFMTFHTLLKKKPGALLI